MPSALKSATARLNGAKSRGPKSAAGREKSSRNSLRHGLTARQTVLLEHENANEFAQVLADYTTTYQPATPAEHDLVKQIATARWRIERLWAMETALLDLEMVRQKPEVRKEFNRADPAIFLALAFRALADASNALSLITRYESRLQRILDRARRNIHSLQEAPKQPPAQPAARNEERKTKNYETNPPAPQPKGPATSKQRTNDPSGAISDPLADRASRGESSPTPDKVGESRPNLLSKAES
jgi:hypothetical protein